MTEDEELERRIIHAITEGGTDAALNILTDCLDEARDLLRPVVGWLYINTDPDEPVDGDVSLASRQAVGAMALALGLAAEACGTTLAKLHEHATDQYALRVSERMLGGED